MSQHTTGRSVPAGSTARSEGHLATFVGIAVAVAGFGAIGLAWNGAAELDYVQGQFPFFVSGGLAGLGLVIVGTTMMVVETVRRQAARDREEIAAMIAALAALHDELARRGSADGGAEGFRPQPRAGGDSAREPVAGGLTQKLER